MFQWILIRCFRLRRGYGRCSSQFSLHPVHARCLRNNPRVVSHFEQTSPPFAAVVSVIQSTFIDVHTDKLIGKLGIEIAGKLHRVAERLFAMINGVLDALAQRLSDAGHRFPPERAPYGVSSKRQRQSGNFLPPPAEIADTVETGLVVTKLA